MMLETLATDALASTNVATTTPGGDASSAIDQQRHNAGITFTRAPRPSRVRSRIRERGQRQHHQPRAPSGDLARRRHVQSTLIALGNATSVVEWSTSLRNLTFLNATASAHSHDGGGRRLPARP
jgi:hypothetical protein